MWPRAARRIWPKRTCARFIPTRTATTSTQAPFSPLGRRVIGRAPIQTLAERDAGIPSLTVSTSLIAPENDYRSLMGGEIESPNLRVAVVVPVYNRVGLLERTLAGVASQTYPRSLLSVVVADDGSTENVAGAVSAAASDLDVQIVRREHIGYGAGQARNTGAKAAEHAEILVFFDADCIPDLDAVQRHAVWHHLADNLVVIGSRHQADTSSVSAQDISTGRVSLRERVFGSDTPEKGAWVSEDFRAVLHRRTASLRHGDMAFRSLVSSNFSVRRDLFLSVGGFSNDFTRWGGEDTELGWRLWNEGAFFIDQPTAAIYHQAQEDSGEEGWREESRAANDSLIQSKIPHRHYRDAVAGVINEAPKVSAVVHAVNPNRLVELVQQLLDQRLGDIEILLTGDDSKTVQFLERRKADPRIRGELSVENAIRAAGGEFVALIHGATGLDHRLLSRSVSAIEKRPDFGWVASAYGVPTTDGLDVYRKDADRAGLDRVWGTGLPLFAMTRRRDLMKGLRAGMNLKEAWQWVTEALEPVSHGTPLVIVPAPSPGEELPISVKPPTSLRSMVISDLKTGGAKAATAPIRAVKAALTGTPYRSSPVPPQKPEHPGDGRRPTIRYVGWTGQSNLGDEVMLEATADLFSEADVTTQGESFDLLMLGGGTLINRGYLRHLRPLDSPRVERVAFGTGVANPEYWGEPREDPADWIDFLESCAFVGVRGPISAEIMNDWGLKRDVEIIGDPALSLQASAVEKVEGRVVVCPAWSRELLWGGSDQDVISAFAGLVRYLRAEGHDVWALSAFPGDDRYIIDMMRQAGAPDLPYLPGHDEVQPAVDLLASADLVVSERLHGAVLAAAAGTIPVMVEYRPKLRDFARSMNLGDLVIRTDSLGEGSLTEMVKSAFLRRADLLGPMMERVSEYRTRQSRAAASISELLTR